MRRWGSSLAKDEMCDVQIMLRNHSELPSNDLMNCVFGSPTILRLLKNQTYLREGKTIVAG